MRSTVVNYYRELRISFIRFKAVMKIPSALAIVTIVFVSVATETLTDVVSSLQSRLILMAGLGILVIIFFKKWEIPFRREAASFGQVDDDKLVHRKGLVILVGLDDKPEKPITKLLKAARSAEFIAFVGTPEVKAKGSFDKLIDSILPAAGLNIASENILVLDRANAFSVADSHAQANEAINWMFSKGLSPAEIVVDISEGSRSMHMGSDRAAHALSVEVQYLGPIWNHVENAPIPGSSAFKVVSEIY